MTSRLPLLTVTGSPHSSHGTSHVRVLSYFSRRDTRPSGRSGPNSTQAAQPIAGPGPWRQPSAGLFFSTEHAAIFVRNDAQAAAGASPFHEPESHPAIDRFHRHSLAGSGDLRNDPDLRRIVWLQRLAHAEQTGWRLTIGGLKRSQVYPVRKSLDLGTLGLSDARPNSDPALAARRSHRMHCGGAKRRARNARR